MKFEGDAGSEWGGGSLAKQQADKGAGWGGGKSSNEVSVIGIVSLN